MKASEHKTTTAEVLAYLLDGDRSADEVGERFWPDKIGFGPSRGGPSSVAVAASYMLGRMRKKGFVGQNPYPDKRWYLTATGHRYLRNAIDTETEALLREVGQ